MKSTTYCILSGFFASLASLCAKFAMGKEESLWLCESICAFYHNQSQTLRINNYPICQQANIAIRGVFFLLMIFSNVFMWTWFVKALRHSKTSLQATVTNTAANFIFTVCSLMSVMSHFALFGELFFGEFLPLVWWLGTVFIVFGWLLMHKGNTQHQLEQNTKKFL